MAGRHWPSRPRQDGQFTAFHTRLLISCPKLSNSLPRYFSDLEIGFPSIMVGKMMRVQFDCKGTVQCSVEKTKLIQVISTVKI